MVNKTFMEKLLDGVEVEWKKLGEVVKLKKGKQLNKELLSEDGLYPAYNGGISYSGFTNNYNYNENTIIISQGGASAGFVNFVKTKFYANAHCYVVLPELEKVVNRYVYHFLKLNQEKLTNKQHGAGIPALRTSEILNLPISIPPLHVQKEIVRILDTFTELTAELTARKKQYNYYRDKLFTFEDGEVEWKTLGELCVIGDGLHGTPKYNDSGDYYFINGNNLNVGVISYNDKTRKVDDSMFKKHGIVFTAENTVFLSINGTIGSVSLYNNEKIVLGKSVAYFNIISSELYSKYLFYFLQTGFSKKNFESKKTGSTIKNLGLKALRAFQIPIPALNEQERIVSILDKFNSLTSSITEGLPHEIELRQKQYEYYRNMLLSSPRDEVE